MLRACVSAVVLVLAACGGAAGSAAGSDDETTTTASTGVDASTRGTSTTHADGTDDTGELDTTETTATGEGTTGEPPAGGPRYDDVRQKSAHNAFQRDEALFDMAVWHRVRSIELDIHVGKTFEPDLAGDWYVYHTDITDDATSCVHLSDCIGELDVLARAVPQHEVVTVWIDLKDPWGSDHGPAELDALLASILGERLLRPADLVARCPGARSVQAAALDPACGWPTLLALRGRVIVVLTGGDTALAAYDGTAAFVAPAIGSVADMSSWPQTAIFNAVVDDVTLAGEIASAGGVVRVYGLDDEPSWAQGLAADVQHLATDMVNADTDPWARTHADDGWPFACRDASPRCVAQGPEPAAIVGVDVDSGDLWGTADDAWFLHVDRTGDPDGTWSAFVATENSWVEPFAKGCLVARTGLEPGAAGLAVCRPADDGRLRVQVRASAGASTTATEADVVAPETIDPEGAAFVRLRVSQDGTCAAGDGSRDGEHWVEIAAQCFSAPLVLQGLTASSHDGGVVRLLFGDLVLDDAPLDLAALTGAALGTASAQAWDGIAP